MRNDDPHLNPGALNDHYDALLIGPGPGKPSGAPGAKAMLGAAVKVRKPVLGVCLGLQAIGEYFGGTVGHAPQIVHGKTSLISHAGTGVFEGLPSPFMATRYHSLCVSRPSLPPSLRISATSDDGVIQGLEHVDLPVYGVQFHPESILSEHGAALARNFIRRQVPS